MKFFSCSELHLGLVFLTFMELSSIFASKDAMDDYDESPEKSSQVEVRAVFINCEPVEEQSVPDNEMTRFQRQELFKHNVLRDCNRKLALTVKMSSEDNKSPGEEYIPIDHVFEGANRKRVRLINPYILRLLRESPLQAYMLHRMDTVNGILLQSDRGKFEDKDKKKRGRMQRDVDHMSEADEWSQVLGSAASVFTLEHEDAGRQSYSVRVGNLQDLMQDIDTTSSTDTQIHKDCSLSLFNETTKSKKVTDRITNTNPVLTMFDHQKQAKNLPKKHHKAQKDVCVKDNRTWIREKRHKQNNVVDGAMNHRVSPRVMKNHYIQRLDQEGDIPEPLEMPSDIFNAMRNQELERSSDSNPYLQSEPYRPDLTGSISHGAYESEKNKANISTETENGFYQKFYNIKNRNVHKYPDKMSDESKSEYESNNDISGRDFALYEIGSPNLWYTVHVQLFEKLSTPEGKTVWNDITKGEQASVSSVHPEWLGQDMSLRYRPAEWVSRDDYTLPVTSLCLLEPLHDSNANISDDDDTIKDKSKYWEYIVVPIEDVVGLDVNKNVDKRNNENSQNYSSTSSPHDEKQSHRRVKIRVSRALFGGSGDSFNIATEGSDQFLTLPYRRPHHAQIELEVRADDNELVRVGVVARDCGPELSGLINEKGSEGIAAGPVLLPPKHTRRLRLQVPIEIPVDVAHCSVALVNDKDEAVAERDVVIKKGDRCFCVWHCNCVCLSEDPKLICREMPPSRQAAAGLSSHERPRHARSCCYKDNITLNMTVIMIGVLFTLLILGIIKAVLGLECRCVGSWGLEWLLHMPRKLDHYYERHLRHLPVQYDEESWPVHPETKKRTVRLLSRPTEFMLNLVFFVTVPCLLLKDTMCSILAFFKQLISKKKPPKKVCDYDAKECFSTQDMQSVAKSRRQQRRKSLRQWMSPHAEQLSTDIWLKGLTPYTTERCETMQPLLFDPSTRHGTCVPPSCADSEQDDTDYVLMQMQKSRESLLRSQRKPNDSGVSTARNQWKGDAMQSKR